MEGKFLPNTLDKLDGLLQGVEWLSSLRNPGVLPWLWGNSLMWHCRKKMGQPWAWGLWTKPWSCKGPLPLKKIISPTLLILNTWCEEATESFSTGVEKIKKPKRAPHNQSSQIQSTQYEEANESFWNHSRPDTSDQHKKAREPLIVIGHYWVLKENLAKRSSWSLDEACPLKTSGEPHAETFEDGGNSFDDLHRSSKAIKNIKK